MSAYLFLWFYFVTLLGPGWNVLVHCNFYLRWWLGDVWRGRGLSFYTRTLCSKNLCCCCCCCCYYYYFSAIFCSVTMNVNSTIRMKSLWAFIERSVHPSLTAIVSYFPIFELSTIPHVFGQQLWNLDVLILTLTYISLSDEIKFMPFLCGLLQ